MKRDANLSKKGHGNRIMKFLLRMYFHSTMEINYNSVLFFLNRVSNNNTNNNSGSSSNNNNDNNIQ